MDLIKIGKYIAFKRKEQGLTQKQLAEKLNMSDKSVSKWERGICLPDVSVYLELCKILDISINEFLAGEDIPKETIEQKAEENKEESKGMSIAALILGIVSLVMLCIWYISIPCSILAIIFGILGRKKGGKGMGTAGLVLGIITVAFLIIIYILLDLLEV